MPVKGSCHCGATQFEVGAPPSSVASCNCSYCSKRGALWAYYRPEQFRLTTARDRVSTYQWGDYMVQSHFCGVCGCTTYVESPGWADGEPDFDHPRIGVNARLLDGLDLDALPVEKLNGRDDW